MIGVSGGVARTDFNSIRQLMRTFTIYGHNRQSPAYKQLSILNSVPSPRSATLKKYAPNVEMSMWYLYCIYIYLSSCVYFVCTLVLVSQKLCDDGSVDLIFTEFGDCTAKRIPVRTDPKYTSLYIPLLRQCIAFGRSREYFHPVDLRLDRNSAFARSQACQEWQPCHFSQV